MSGGFWAGAVPPWAAVVWFCTCLFFLLVGMWVGWGRGERRAVRDEAEQRAERAAVRQIRQWRVPPGVLPMPLIVAEDPASAAYWRKLDQAAGWDGHVAQALALTAASDPITTGEIAAITTRMDRFLEELAGVPYSADELWNEERQR